MQVETVTNFAEYKASSRGANGMILNVVERGERRAAGDAYCAAFPLRVGRGSHRAQSDAATQYANYQIAMQRGWAHLAPSPVHWDGRFPS